MVRWVLVLGFALLMTGFFSALSVVLGVSNMPFLPVILLVTYLITTESGIEGMLLTVVLGLFLDACAGYLLGINILICLGLFLAATPFGGLFGAPRGVAAFLLGSLSAMAYTLIHDALFTLFGNGGEGLSLSATFQSGLWNGVLGIVMFPLVDWLFIYFGYSERELSLTERLSSRTAIDRRR